MTMALNEALRVDGNGFSYPIYISDGVLDRLCDILRQNVADADRRRYILIGDKAVMALYGDKVLNTLRAEGFSVAARRDLPTGESAKSFAELEQTLDVMLSAGIDRQSVVLALGGGVAGDHAGFAAAIALRGLAFVQIPTTLLAMVDSAVGGKTGINMPQGKNLVGSFHQPDAVIADIAALQSLPERDFMAGYAEVVKYAFIRDRAFFSYLQDHMDAIKGRDRDVLTNMITRSCRHKADIVAADEKEKGMRALLNLGHTFGHALEAENGYGPELLHGEAVAIGMAMAFSFSARCGVCDKGAAEAAIKHLDGAGLPVHMAHIPKLTGLNADKMMAHMRKDKKVQLGQMRFILTRDIGAAFIADDVKDGDMRNFLDAYIKDGHII